MVTAMSDRSELMKWVLRTWDYSDEGRKYLEWFLQPGIETLDGGAVLRESVLDLMEDDKQLNELRRQRHAAVLEELLSNLPSDERASLKDHDDHLQAFRRLQAESFRRMVGSEHQIRRKLNLERLDALKLISQIPDSLPPEEVSGLFSDTEIAQALTLFEKRKKQWGIADEVASKIASLSRTQTEAIDVETEWRLHSVEDPLLDEVKRIVDDPGEDSFDSHREKFDRFYAQQAITKLEGVIDRMSILQPVNLEVTNHHVSQLFREAHGAFLFGFDAAAIALCRCLIEHALKDRLSGTGGKTLKALIPLAGKKNVLKPKSFDNANKVQHAGNKIMHDVANLRHTAQEVLDCTRQVLNDLYGTAATI
jgi:hypothetical protein